MIEALDISKEDVVLPFYIESLGVRGKVLRLGASLQDILQRHDYPQNVEKVVAEAIAVCALIGTSLKFDGRFQLQTQSDGVIPMIVVDLVSPGSIRACARFDVNKLEELIEDAGSDILLGNGHVGFAIDQTDISAISYRGLVALESGNLSEAASSYFVQSEQIPTFLKIAFGKVRDSEGIETWQAGGFLIQSLPASFEEDFSQLENDPTILFPDIGTENPKQIDKWHEAIVFSQTLQDEELLDNNLGLDEILFRLFNEYQVSVLSPITLKDQCTCSEERVRNIVSQFSADQVEDMLEEDGKIGVACEFCGAKYRFFPKG